METSDPGATIPGHAFLPGPFTSKGLEDIPAEGPAGYARCECGPLIGPAQLGREPQAVAR